MTSLHNPYHTWESSTVKEKKISQHQRHDQMQSQKLLHLQNRICEKNSNSHNVAGLRLNRCKLALNLLSTFCLWIILCVVDNDIAGILVISANNVCETLYSLDNITRVRGSVAVNPAMLELISYNNLSLCIDVDYTYPVDEEIATQPGFGVSAVCNGTADIGVMERAIQPKVDKLKRLTPVDRFVNRFVCMEGAQPLREIIQVPILIDAMVVFVGKTSRAWNHCMINKTEGLNRDELRWMFSAATTSFEPPYNQNISRSIRRWNQLVNTSSCQSTEKNDILIAIPNNNVTDKQRWFKQLVFNEALSGVKEDFRPWVGIFNDKSDELRGAVVNQPWSVGFCSYSYYRNNTDKLQALAINGVLPNDKSIEEGRYDFFARRIYANFWKQSLDFWKQLLDIEGKSCSKNHYEFLKRVATNITKSGEFVPLPLNIYNETINRVLGCYVTPTRIPLNGTRTDDALRNIQNAPPPSDGSRIIINVTDPIVTPNKTNTTNTTYAYNVTDLQVSVICRVPEGCLFDGVHLEGNGMFFGRNASLYLEDISFTNTGSPTLVTEGSVISVENNSNLTVNNCIFSNNSMEEGGVLHINGGNASIHDSIFHESSAWRGAAMDIVTGNVVIDSVSFENNKAIRYGGSIFVACETKVLVKNSIFKNNLSVEYGGAIAVTNSGAIVQLENVIFQNNSAGQDGAAIYVTAGGNEVNITKGSFLNNTSSAPLQLDRFNNTNDDESRFDRIMSRITDRTKKLLEDILEPKKPKIRWSAISIEEGKLSLIDALFSDNYRVSKRNNATANIFIKGGNGSCSNVTFCDGLGISDPGEKKNTNCRGSNIIKGKSGTPPCPN